MDGEMKVLTGGEVRFNGDYEVLRATWMDSVTYQFTDFAYPSVTDLTNAYNGQTSTYTASGQVSVAGMDTFTANLSVTEAGSRSREGAPGAPASAASTAQRTTSSPGPSEMSPRPLMPPSLLPTCTAGAAALLAEEESSQSEEEGVFSSTDEEGQANDSEAD